MRPLRPLRSKKFGSFTATDAAPHVHTDEQEYCQQRGFSLPVYNVEAEGPDNCRRFIGVSVVFGPNTVEGDPQRFGTSKAAQFALAKKALDLL